MGVGTPSTVCKTAYHWGSTLKTTDFKSTEILILKESHTVDCLVLVVSPPTTHWSLAAKCQSCNWQQGEFLMATARW